MPQVNNAQVIYETVKLGNSLSNKYWYIQIKATWTNYTRNFWYFWTWQNIYVLSAQWFEVIKLLSVKYYKRGHHSWHVILLKISCLPAQWVCRSHGSSVTRLVTTWTTANGCHRGHNVCLTLSSGTLATWKYSKISVNYIDLFVF